MKNIAIVCVAYNRLDPLRRLLSSLENAWYDDIPVDLIISVDKSNTDMVEKFADTFNWNNGNCIVRKHQENLGLRKHILSIGELLEEEYEAVVVLEDDITVSPNFMRYVRQCVDKYYYDDRIAGISLYKHVINSDSRMPFSPLRNEYDVFFMAYAMSWGEVWMRNQWKGFIDWYDINSSPFCLDYMPANVNRWSNKSWLKYHIRYCLENQKYFVYPYESLSTNNDDVGTHISYYRTINQTMLMNYSKKKYCLPTFDEQYVKYDTFFEPVFLGKYLNIENRDLTVDLFGMKNVKYYNRYVISLQNLPFKIIESFSLKLKPFEQNIIQGNKGVGIWLYDSKVRANNKNTNYSKQIFEYYFGESYKHVLRIYPISIILKDKLHIIFSSFIRKILKLKR